jgi:hypothetical protein
MAALVIILLATLGLGVNAVAHRRPWSAADSEHDETDNGLVDMCTWTFVLVFLSLLGLMGLGMMYGNVLGSARTIP